jgi:hypothetical protein
MLRQRPLLAEGSPHETPKLSSYDPSGWAARGEEINESNILWRQYLMFVELYRYYIDLVWKASIWYYTAMGVSLAYFFAHLNARNHGYLPLLLVFLGAMSVGMSLIYARVVHYVGQMESWLDYIAVSLRLPGRPHVEFIRSFCRFTSATLLLIAVSCLGFFAYLHT